MPVECSVECRRDRVDVYGLSTMVRDFDFLHGVKVSFPIHFLCRPLLLWSRSVYAYLTNRNRRSRFRTRFCFLKYRFPTSGPWRVYRVLPGFTGQGRDGGAADVPRRPARQPPRDQPAQGGRRPPAEARQPNGTEFRFI